MRLSEHFVLSEFLSPRDTGKPSRAQVTALINLCARVLEPLRDALGRPIRITSGWRSWLYNLKVGGAPNGQHPKGTAADIAVTDDDEALLILALLSRNPDVGGLGFYPGRGFVHVDIRPRRAGNQITTWERVNGKYRPLSTSARSAIIAKGGRDF
jgi:hypothetical protein